MRFTTRLTALFLLASGVAFAQDPALRMDQAAVRIDGKAGGSGGTPTGTANRLALFGGAGTLTTDAGATYTGTGSNLVMTLGGATTPVGLSRGGAKLLAIGNGTAGDTSGSIQTTTAISATFRGANYFGILNDGASALQLGSTASIDWSSTTLANWPKDLTLTRAAAATLQLGKAANGTPVANTLIIGESGSGTNIAGANGTISSGIGTGSGAGSSLIFQTPAAHGSDAVAQTPTTRLTLGPNGITLPDNGLGTVTPGTLEYKGHTAYFTTYLVRRSIVLAQEVPVTATSVGPSDTTETTVYTIPMAANYLTVGKKINVRLNGTITQRNNASSFATIRVKYAGATVFSVTTPASTALAAQPFEIDIRTVCRAIGSGTSGKLISFGKFNVNGDLVAPKLVMGALTSIDTTAANTFTVTIQWNESNASTGPFTVEMGETLCVDANT